MESIPDFAALLRAQGFKATPGRLTLLRTLWLAKRPLTVDQIGRKLDLDVATVYRALNYFVQKGLVMRGVGAAAAHFSYPRGFHHHHLMCSDCGFIKECTNCN